MMAADKSRTEKAAPEPSTADLRRPEGPKHKILRPADFFLIGAYILAIAASAVYAARAPADGGTAVVTVDGRPVVKLDLQEAGSLTVHGAPGDVMVEVREGGVRVTSAECPNKVCVRTGRISRSGEVILCAPNRVLIRIAGRRGDGARGVTG